MSVAPLALRTAKALVALPILMAAGGCDLVVGPTERPAGSVAVAWSAVPLPPSPVMIAEAEEAGSHCQRAREPVRVAVGDRRTESVVAFILVNATRLDTCVFAQVDGHAVGPGAKDEPLPEPLTTPLGAEIGSGFQINGVGDLRVLGGRVVGGIVRVQVSLADGRFIFGSIANGLWLATWPGTTLATRVTPFNAGGIVVATVENPQ